MRTLAYAMVAVALAAIGASSAAGEPTVPPCATEDAAGPCRWDAATQGNGQGRSFTINADQTITYDQ